MAQSVIDVIYVTGGFTDSALWVQMLADMFNLPVMVCAAEESAALGAVMIGLQALQLPPVPPGNPVKCLGLRPAIIPSTFANVHVWKEFILYSNTNFNAPKKSPHHFTTPLLFPLPQQVVLPPDAKSFLMTGLL